MNSQRICESWWAYEGTRRRRARWRAIRNFILGVTFGMLLALGLVWAGFSALEREDAMRDEIRKERCARFGENIPKEWGKYCENLGV